MASSTTLGKYQLIAELGRGGMAEVYLAVSSGAAHSFSKLVVVKRLREHLAGDLDFVTMLVDEARIAARLNHPNLVQTIEIGEADGQYFLTMEFLDGQPLHRVLNRAKGRMPLEAHLAILSDVCRGMEYAHNLQDYDRTPLNIVHRDVTPHNVFVTYDGQTKVVDFGIAKAAGRISETRHGVVKGKTSYMAPEQALGRHIDRRVDVFAIGVMIYEAAVQGRMWKGVAETDIVRRIVTGQIPTSPKAIRNQLDDELDAICARALAVDREQRYASCAELQHDLDAYLTRVGRPSHAGIGEVVKNLFADSRKKTKEIIDRQLVALKNSASQQSSMNALSQSSNPVLTDGHGTPANNAPVGPTGTVVGAVGVSMPPPGARTGAGRSDAPPAPTAPPAPEPRVDLLGMVRAKPAAVIPILAATVFLAVATTLATVLAFTALTRPPTAHVTEARMVTVTLRASPMETKFSVDEGPGQDNPFIGTFTADSKVHNIKATATGYVPQSITTTFEKDVSLRLMLAPLRTSGSAPTSSSTRKGP